ncbi:TonB family protein [Ancylomarina sp. 16SWW S1-10-2]|uniref:M56 family metallopeptidase n=1 Tax=Ancylomarina sp. 16SWW S1-10-2 TaxID=2499681 RepID=UPI0012ADFA93|nr:M56 family metallopeptidase [Ancylomarina sp. 16SWW S1-10-2]MRT94175.1 M56 family peptidase [Ancylomarina sp. 16SWW S1-10-2]
MNDLYIYLIKSSIVLTIFYGIYHFFLQDEKFYKGIRIYLASSIILAFVLPLIKMNFAISEAANSSNIVVLLNAINLNADKTNTNEALTHITSTQLLAGLYTSVCIILVLRSIIRIRKTQNIINKYPIDQFEGQKLVKVDDETPNFSFFGKIAINTTEHNAESFRNIIAHEKIHVEQKHWIDLLLVELTTILLWFNPFAWLFERAIKQTHELLADEGVIAQGCNIGQYQASILNQIMGTEIMGLANNFNYSITKKRLIMMTKTNTSKNRIFRLLFIIPAIAIALTLNLQCTEKSDGILGEEEQTVIRDADGNVIAESIYTEVDDKLEEIFVVCDDMPEFPGGDLALQSWISENIKYPDIAVESSIQGRVYIGFVVNKTGHVEQAKVLRGVAPSLDAEALRVVSSMPTWKPGKQRDEAVSVQYTVPINFALQ